MCGGNDGSARREWYGTWAAASNVPFGAWLTLLLPTSTSNPPHPQENIICMRKPGEVQHPLIPQLFVGFSPEDGAYIPGPRLRAQYPADF